MSKYIAELRKQLKEAYPFKVSLTPEAEEMIKNAKRGGKTHMSHGFGVMLSDVPRPRSNFMCQWSEEEEIENLKYNLEHNFTLCMYDYPKIVQNGKIWRYING